jgi:hypothetical protein
MLKSGPLISNLLRPKNGLDTGDTLLTDIAFADKHTCANVSCLMRAKFQEF